MRIQSKGSKTYNLLCKVKDMAISETMEGRKQEEGVKPGLSTLFCWIYLTNRRQSQSTSQDKTEPYWQHDFKEISGKSRRTMILCAYKR